MLLSTHLSQTHTRARNPYKIRMDARLHARAVGSGNSLIPKKPQVQVDLPVKDRTWPRLIRLQTKQIGPARSQNLAKNRIRELQSKVLFFHLLTNRLFKARDLVNVNEVIRHETTHEFEYVGASMPIPSNCEFP